MEPWEQTAMIMSRLMERFEPVQPRKQVDRADIYEQLIKDPGAFHDAAANGLKMSDALCEALVSNDTQKVGELFIECISLALWGMAGEEEK